MKRLILVALFLLSSCSVFKTPSREASNAIATTVSQERIKVNEQAAGVNSAIEFTAEKLPASREKDVILMFTDDQYRIVGHPSLELQTSFQKAATELLSADAAERAKGEQARIALGLEVQKLKDNLKSLEDKFDEVRKTEEANHKAEIDKIRLEQEATTKKLVSWIFFGLAALAMVAGVASLVLAGSNPAFGPKISFLCFAVGAISAGMGVVIIQLLKQIDEHPWILWTGCGIIVTLLVAAGVLLYSNHFHHEETKNGNP